jgi:hypothetical protein
VARTTFCNQIGTIATFFVIAQELEVCSEKSEDFKRRSSEKKIEGSREKQEKREDKKEGRRKKPKPKQFMFHQVSYQVVSKMVMMMCHTKFLRVERRR